MLGKITLKGRISFQVSVFIALFVEQTVYNTQHRQHESWQSNITAEHTVLRICSQTLHK